MALKTNNRKPISSLILGLDPGSYHTGFSVIELQNQDLSKVLSYGVWSFSKNQTVAFRLAELFTQLERLLKKYKIDTLVLENIFLGVNTKSAFILGHVRGVCLASLAKHNKNIQILEYTPTYVKKYITGKGHCSKVKMQEFLEKNYQLNFEKYKNTSLLDASDAVAIALCAVQRNTIETQNLRI